MLQQEKCGIDEIFRHPICPPYYYSFTLPQLKTTTDLFNHIMHLYTRGAVILFGTNSELRISTLDEDKRLILKQYMLSVGINVRIYDYTEEDVSDIFEFFYNELHAKTKNIQIKKHICNGYITGLSFNIPRCFKKQELKNISDLIISKQEYINILPTLIINKKNNISYYSEKFKINNKFYIIRFFV
tara:strand:- start:503 stop:1060 length:558 start_codon:yes stop_codon:yes gene_type:complete